MKNILCSICKTPSGDFHNFHENKVDLITTVHDHIPYTCPVRRCGMDLDTIEKRHVQARTGEVAHTVRCGNGHRFFITSSSAGPQVGINMLAKW